MEHRPRDGAKTRADIREAAIALFYVHGYEATSMRNLADEVGVKVGSLYNHMGGKDELLLDIMTSVMDELLGAVHAAVDAAGADPLDQLKAFIDAHLRFHAHRARETFIGNSELRALSPEQRRVVSGRRRDYEELLRGHVVAATQASGVTLLDARLQTYAVLALGMHLASWFRDTGKNSLEHVVQIYTEVSLRQLGLVSPTARARPTRKASSSRAGSKVS
jgi:AcrR family transcriptional regulator